MLPIQQVPQSDVKIVYDTITQDFAVVREHVIVNHAATWKEAQERVNDLVAADRRKMVDWIAGVARES